MCRNSSKGCRKPEWMKRVFLKKPIHKEKVYKMQKERKVDLRKIQRFKHTEFGLGKPKSTSS